MKHLGLEDYQRACAFDRRGRENEAIPFYESAIKKGLKDRDLEGAYLGLGSSYRCIGKNQKAVAVLKKAALKFPQCRAMKVFLALALHKTGKSGAAMKILLKELAETSSNKSIREYRKAILFYAGKFK